MYMKKEKEERACTRKKRGESRAREKKRRERKRAMKTYLEGSAAASPITGWKEVPGAISLRSETARG